MLHATILAIVASGFLLSPMLALGQEGGRITLSPEPWDSCYSHHGVECSIDIPPDSTRTLYLLAVPNIASTNGGVSGAEFRVVGKPPGLWTEVEPNPVANVVLGYPFSNDSQPIGSQGGCNIAFPECQVPDANAVVLLYTVRATNLGGVANAELWVTRKDPASDLRFPCPLLNACDAPAYTARCVEEGGPLVINRTAPVASRSWQSVKRLYR